MHLKRIIYITAFTFLGILLSFLVHGAIEIPYSTLLIKNFEIYGLGLSWDSWFLIHHVGAVVLFIAGTLFGYWQGKYWWKVIYEDKRSTTSIQR